MSGRIEEARRHVELTAQLDQHGRAAAETLRLLDEQVATAEAAGESALAGLTDAHMSGGAAKAVTAARQTFRAALADLAALRDERRLVAQELEDRRAALERALNSVRQGLRRTEPKCIEEAREHFRDVLHSVQVRRETHPNPDGSATVHTDKDSQLERRAVARAALRELDEALPFQPLSEPEIKTRIAVLEGSLPRPKMTSQRVENYGRAPRPVWHTTTSPAGLR